MKTISEYVLGDMLARYIRDDAGHAGLLLIPAGMRDCVLEKEMAVAPLAEVHFRGDSLPHGYAGGQSLAGTRSSAGLIFRDQRREGNRIVTELSDPEGRTVLHYLSWQEGSPALRCSTRFENRSSRPVTLELLSSMNLGGITPFTPGDAAGFLNIFRARSNWSAEGRLTCESAESLSLEPSWTHHAVRVEKFGQIGSMPVRHYFPFLAVRDESAGVTWAFQLACPSSWQFELRRQDDGLTVLAGLADFDFGHWAKTLQPGEGITSPEAYLTVSRDGVDRTSQRLLSLHREQWARRGEPLPVIFNEYCTTWGNPSHENLSGIISCLKGKDIDYLVIDAGWYLKEGAGWSDCSGDWIPSRTLFPRGIDAVAREIREAGMKPGLWFEAETCAAKSDLFSRTELLLTRDGAVLDTENRRFLDLRKPEAQAYLDERVISTLKENGFAYVKIDYNDTIGTGCDDPDSLGEGLRQNMLAAQDFFRRMKERIPGLMIENCASGGHRLEPSMLALSDIASFSDAHECQEIPIIAASLHRLMLPGQSQIWAVLRKTDSLRRIGYSLVNTFLGVLCLSGDITDLSEAQWAAVEEGIRFYREAGEIIRDGISSFFGPPQQSWRHPKGWQAVARTLGQQTLTAAHAFAFGPEEREQTAEIPLDGPSVIRRIYCTENLPVTLEGNLLRIRFTAPFQAAAVLTDALP